MLNCVVALCADGQTSSGKTYTMAGVINLAVADLFSRLRADAERDFSFQMSYIEIYNEIITDLLNTKTGANLQVREDVEVGRLIRALARMASQSQPLEPHLIVCVVSRRACSLAA